VGAAHTRWEPVPRPLAPSRAFVCLGPRGSTQHRSHARLRVGAANKGQDSRALRSAQRRKSPPRGLTIRHFAVVIFTHTHFHPAPARPRKRGCAPKPPAAFLASGLAPALCRGIPSLFSLFLCSGWRRARLGHRATCPSGLAWGQPPPAQKFQRKRAAVEGAHAALLAARKDFASRSSQFVPGSPLRNPYTRPPRQRSLAVDPRAYFLR
jgi:hypothetical protein